MALKRRRALKQALNLGFGTDAIPADAGGFLVGDKIGLHTFVGEAYVAAEAFSGSNAGEKIAAAHSALPSTGGVIDARGLTTALTASGTITLTKKVTLLLPQRLTLQGATGIDVQAAGCVILGQGQNDSIITYNPTGTGTAIKWSATTATTIAGGRISGFTLDGTGNSQVKTGLNIIDAAELLVSDLQISNWTDATKATIGVRIQGRQTVVLDRLTVNADQPFRLSISPNTSTVAIDHCTFRDCYGTADPTKYVWLIDSDVFLTNTHWVGGYNAHVFGAGCIFWDAASAASRSYNVSIMHMRWEQSTTAAAWMFYLVPKAFSNALTLMDNYSDSNHKGFYLRNWTSGIVAGNLTELLTTPIDVDSTCGFVVLGNFFNMNAGATPITTGFAGIWMGNDASGSTKATGRIGAGVPNPTNQVVVPNNTAFGSLTTGGTEKRLLKIDSANSHVEIDGEGQDAYTGGSLSVDGDRSTNGNPLVIANNAWIAAHNSAAAAKGMIKLDASDRVVMGEDTSKAFIVNGVSISFAGAPLTGSTIFRGTGDPNTVVTGVPGDLYINLSGGANTGLWVKESGTSTNTGWVAK